MWKLPSLPDLLDRLICKFLAQKPIAPEQLARLECGVYLYCWRLALKYQHSPALYNTLKTQAWAEYRHARMLCAYSGIPLPAEPQAVKHGQPSWGTIEGVQVDGISDRYLAARIFFGFKKASEHSLSDQLAFMAVLERFQTVFYEELAQVVDGPLAPFLEALAAEEKGHAESLQGCLEEWEPKGMHSRLFKWQVRKYLALLFVPFCNA